MPCEYGPAAAGALSVAINSCALTVVEILCFFIWCFLAADSAHKLRAVMDDEDTVAGTFGLGAGTGVGRRRA